MNIEQAAQPTALKIDLVYNLGAKDTTVSEATTTILLHHLESFQNNYLKELLSDYTDQSILIPQEETFVGLANIEAFFMALSLHFSSKESNFELDKMVIWQELAFIVWRAITPTLNVPFGTDTFIIKHGKIQQQTFAGQLKFLFLPTNESKLEVMNNLKKGKIVYRFRTYQ